MYHPTNQCPRQDYKVESTSYMQCPRQEYPRQDYETVNSSYIQHPQLNHKPVYLSFNSISLIFIKCVLETVLIELPITVFIKYSDSNPASQPNVMTASAFHMTRCLIKDLADETANYFQFENQTKQIVHVAASAIGSVVKYSSKEYYMEGAMSKVKAMKGLITGTLLGFDTDSQYILPIEMLENWDLLLVPFDRAQTYKSLSISLWAGTLVNLLLPYVFMPINNAVDSFWHATLDNVGNTTLAGGDEFEDHV